MEQLNLLLELASVDCKFICILHPPIGLQPVVFSIVDRLIANILCHSLWNRSSILFVVAVTATQWILSGWKMSHESYKLSGHLCSADNFLGRKPGRRFTALDPYGWLLRDSVTITTDESTVTQQLYAIGFTRPIYLGRYSYGGLTG